MVLLFGSLYVCSTYKSTPKAIVYYSCINTIMSKNNILETNMTLCIFSVIRMCHNRDNLVFSPYLIAQLRCFITILYFISSISINTTMTS